MSICYYFHPDGYTTAGRQVMGRHVAGESFLKAALSYGPKTDLWIQIEEKKHVKIFDSIAKSCGRYERINLVDRSNLSKLSLPGCVYYPGPNLGEWSRHRSRYGDASWSLCGITHTTASTRAMDAISSLLTHPVYPWDALICTSRSVQNNVLRILESEADYLRLRFGATKFSFPQLPIIPLGVHAEDFRRSKSSIHRARHQLCIAPDDVVVLFVGRLAFHGKAHPLVMYQALERASIATGRNIVLVECGWHANDYIKNAFSSAASSTCPSVRCIYLDGREPDQLALGWNCADIFASLSDNIQETFGITPIEAMASGLPVVVSDWDGYRDTVRDGIDGYRIPTSMPPPGYGDDLAARHALGIDSYDMYCAHASSLVVVDLDRTTQAFIDLISSRELRLKMGAQGRNRILNVYDWKVIIPMYEALWSELYSLRNHETHTESKSQVWPARLDPFFGFASYPTQKIHPQSLLRLVDTDSATAIRRFRDLIKLEMVCYVLKRMSDQSYLELALSRLSHTSSISADDVIRGIDIDPPERPTLFLSLIWLVKLGLVVAEL